MMSLLIAAALFAGAAQTPAGGQAAEPRRPQAASGQTTISTLVVEGEERKPGPGDTVCKKEPMLGSRMPKRTCMVQADWQQRRVDDRQQLDQSQTNVQGYR
jgi:hypothetical protein